MTQQLNKEQDFLLTIKKLKIQRTWLITTSELTS